MKARSTRLGVELIEDRSVPSTVAYGDFNNDGLVDVAAITNPTTIEVRLANPDGTYTVSATLTAPKNQPVQQVAVVDVLDDGVLDIVAQGSKKSGGRNSSYTHTWLGNGDGTFVYPPVWV
jgi:hypothetical protein